MMLLCARKTTFSLTNHRQFLLRKKYNETATDVDAGDENIIGAFLGREQLHVSLE